MEKSDFILIKGEPRTQQIVSINRDGKGVYWVRFQSGKTFPFSSHDVVIMKSFKEISVTDCHITNKRGNHFKPVHIWEYTHHFHRFYRIEFPQGKIREYDENHLNVKHSVLRDEAARNIFHYLKDVSDVQCIMTENGSISLHEKYEKMDYVGEETVLASYLKPTLMHTEKGYDHLMFPFYSNLSQMTAVDNAFKSQLSIIQGPPGTGKTQTILNFVANIVARKKTVLIVSNNNSAVENVKEKLDKEGLGFLVAKLGKSDNRNDFIERGQTPYPDMENWQEENVHEAIKELDAVSQELKSIFEKQNRLAQVKQELTAIETEGRHFLEENHYVKSRLAGMKSATSGKLISLWVQLDIKHETAGNKECSLWQRIKLYFQESLRKRRLRKIMGKNAKPESDEELLMDIQALFYSVRKDELQSEADALTAYLKDRHADELQKKQTSLSMHTLKAALHAQYKGGKHGRQRFDKNDLWGHPDDVAKEYPVVLSTTFSATSSLPGHVFDYLIMDEASQVSIESAAPALSRARNAVIVGDLKQLPNIITADIKKELEELNEAYKIGEEYNCLTNCFLASVCKVFPNAPQTLLREHYRCVPTIIDFCNQKYYGGKLLIMTQANADTIPMKVIKTVEGNHSRKVSHDDKVLVSNQREVDEFKWLMQTRQDVALEDIGIITPYKGQAMLFHQETGNDRLEADTIHKYQGREKDMIVMSTVADSYNDFVDNPNLINVAVSRAKKEFVLITNGNENPKKGNINDLIDYIYYNHGIIENSKLHSIFDLLYESYAERRKKYLQGKNSISEYDSENIAYHVITSILRRNAEMTCLKVIPHYHLNVMISNTSLLTEAECRFAKSSWSHVDFLIENRVSKCPVLVIEVDGFAYHHQGTKQAERDKLKDSILHKYNIPLLRLSTTGSGEIEKIEKEIRRYVLQCGISL